MIPASPGMISAFVRFLFGRRVPPLIPPCAKIPKFVAHSFGQPVYKPMVQSELKRRGSPHRKRHVVPWHFHSLEAVVLFKFCQTIPLAVRKRERSIGEVGDST